MAAERRWDQRQFRLEESMTQNSGARTVFIEQMTPGTTVVPHLHNRFSETFDLISGSILLYSSTTPDLDALEASAQHLQIGKVITITPGLYHKYKVDGEGKTVLRVTLMPGDADFERLLTIMHGLEVDGELSKMGDSLLLMAVFMDLSDSHLAGPVRDVREGVKAEKKDEIDALKKELLRKYDTEEALRALLAKRL